MLVYRPARSRQPPAAASVPTGPGAPSAAERRPGSDNAKKTEPNSATSSFSIQRRRQVYADDAVFSRGNADSLRSATSCSCRGAIAFPADKAEFDTETRLGTFYNASASPRSSRRSRPRRTAASAPPMAGETGSIFRRETSRRSDRRNTRSRTGGFTTCVQPTPRGSYRPTRSHSMSTTTRCSRAPCSAVKGVPMFYLPSCTTRRTRGPRHGFPDSDLRRLVARGRSLHNAFFWAIDRSRTRRSLRLVFEDGPGRGGRSIASASGSQRHHLRGLDEDETSVRSERRTSSRCPRARVTRFTGAPTIVPRARARPG